MFGSGHASDQYDISGRFGLDRVKFGLDQPIFGPISFSCKKKQLSQKFQVRYDSVQVNSGFWSTFECQVGYGFESVGLVWVSGQFSHVYSKYKR